MKLLGLDIRSSKKATESEKNTAPKGEIGDSGTSFFDGVVTEEYVPKLSGKRGLKVFEEMRKSDGTVRAAILATSLPIRRARWYIQPASEDKADIEIADFINANIMKWMSITWDDFLRQALLMLPYGSMVFEKIFDIKDTKDFGTKIFIKKMAPRLPKSIQNWTTADGEAGIRQLLSTGEEVSIPMEKLCIFINEKEGDNWDGVSILRAAYKHWYYKSGFEKIDAIAFERQGLGIPVADMPEGYTADDESKAVTMLENMRAHQKGYLIRPPGYTVEFMDMKGMTTRDPKNSLAYHNREILIAVLAQFLELGSTNVGSRSLSEDHSDIFLQSLEAVANNIKDVVNKYVIPQLIDFNYNTEVYPEIDYTGISRVDAEALSKTYQQLTQSKGLKPTDGDDKYFREMLGLPIRKEEKNPDDNKSDSKTDNEIDKEMESSEFQRRLNKMLFQEDGVRPYKPWRKLTFAEEKVDLDGINETMNKLELKLSKQATATLAKAKDEYMVKLNELLKKKDSEAIKALTLQYQKDYKELIKTILRDAYIFGKNNASKEMGVKTPATPNEIARNYDLLADTVAKQHTDEIVTKAKRGLVEGLTKSASISTVLGDIDKVLDTHIKNISANTASVLVGEAVNQGRDTVFTKNGNKIYALQRSEILDSKTCFPRFTRILTKNGRKKISNIQIGEYVLTRNGYKKVVDTMSRDYQGPMVKIRTDKKRIRCTSNHPIYSNGRWIEAQDLRAGDNILYSHGDIARKVVTFIHKLFRKSKYLKPMLDKIGIFFFFSRFISVPVRSVSFYNYAKVGNEKINRVSSYFSLLNKLVFSFFNSFSDIFFKRSFSVVGSVAGNRTEASVFNNRRSMSKNLFTIYTGIKNRGSSALLGTMTYVVPIGKKYFPTPFAFFSYFLTWFASKRAISISISIRNWNSKFFIAARAYFSNLFTKVSTFHRTILSSPVGKNFLSTFNTVNRFMFLPFVKALLRAKFWYSRWIYPTMKRFTALLADYFNIISHILNSSILVNNIKTLKVYNLEVEGNHEYFAENILVHNCNYCLSMDGRIIEKNDKLSKVGVYHSFCRGLWVEILETEENKPRITGVPNSLRDRFGNSVNALMQPKNPIVKKDSLANKLIVKK